MIYRIITIASVANIVTISVKPTCNPNVILIYYKPSKIKWYGYMWNELKFDIVNWLEIVWLLSSNSVKGLSQE